MKSRMENREWIQRLRQLGVLMMNQKAHDKLIRLVDKSVWLTHHRLKQKVVNLMNLIIRQKVESSQYSINRLGCGYEQNQKQNMIKGLQSLSQQVSRHISGRRQKKMFMKYYDQIKTKKVMKGLYDLGQTHILQIQQKYICDKKVQSIGSQKYIQNKVRVIR